MLVLALISTLILSLFIIMFFIVGYKDKKADIAGLFLQLLIGFVIAAIWILYAR